jgi:Phospholipase_D-nuclease N-terminal
MLFFDGGAALIFFALWVFCVIDVITTPEPLCRNLPKMAWLFIVILLSDVGSIAWLVAGRTWNSQPADLRYKGTGSRPQARPAARATNPDDDEEFLAGLRARAEEQRRRAREAQRHQDEPPANEPPSA